MAHKTARRKFRPPLKEGASLPCSQTSSTSGLVEGSQERGAGREGSQSWLSQLTTTDDSVSKEPAVTAKFSTAKVVPLHEAVGSKNGLFSMDDSLCSIGVENEKPSNGDAPEDSLSGNDGIISPGIPLHQVTQTHTVLSFCSEDSTPVSELQRESETAAMGKFQIVKYAAEPTVDIYNDLVDAAMEGDTTGNLKEPMSRFQHKSKPSARSYDYSKILPRFGPQRAKSKKGSKNNNSKTRTKKSVTLVVNQGRLQSKISTSAVTDAGHQDTTAKGDLSVYDYQPTPQQEEGEEEGDEREETSVMNNSNWISKRTREEQASINVHLAVDREVLKTIAKTREEIRIIRETYAARKASRKTSLQFTASSKSDTFRVPQQDLRRSHRAKPSLIMREDYGSSSALQKKGPYRMADDYHHQYTALEKEE